MNMCMQYEMAYRQVLVRHGTDDVGRCSGNDAREMADEGATEGIKVIKFSSASRMKILE